MIDLEMVRPEDLWYFIGYLATDGNLSKDGRHLNITSKDRKHLFQIRHALGLTNKVGRKTRAKQAIKLYSQIQFGDVKFYHYLISIGLTPRKSLSLKQIDLDKSYLRDFLRGVIDGDGNISTWTNRSNNHVQWSLRITSAARDFITWLKSLMEEKYLVRGKLYKQVKNSKPNPLFTLKFGKLSAKKVLQDIYYLNCLCLKRKYLKALRCLKDENKMVKYGSVIMPG